MSKILTGNELLSGATVYLDAQGRWVEALQAARVFGKDEAEALEATIAAAKATGRVISLESEDVEMRDGAIYPIRIRERIRAEGPTAPRFERQHLAEDEYVSI
ncbi:DUF2849 domain-containing protein [Pelagibacterium sp. H642]|uniref:DUF2849 domain-containing protein n=1 Tax=Pelagibacterium sp. H642 TaxID=1881069 RepID=UPI002814F2D9|nr:DUF2849 domain-containing protein [Pelagibacterium sp. H642]WMT89967.1 DUF2849 domain-containing protein [Pelagibacterium sp. H642]